MDCAKIAIKLGLKRPPSPPERYIPLGPKTKEEYKSPDYTLDQLYVKNEIKTSRYTWYGFIFQNLVEQAQRIANFYFICVAIIQLFTDSPVTPITSILPLLFVFAVTMIKQGYEDYLRHKADKELNSQRFEIVTSKGQLRVVRSMDITVGDILLCRDNCTFPCDLLLISTSENNGECFVTTSSLDGETNLKRFVATESTRRFDNPSTIAAHLDGHILCQQPTVDFYTFNGRLTFKNAQNSSEEKVSPLGTENLLLRGACLRNTDFVYAVAVYTGSDTKLALNSKGKKVKFSQVERMLNKYLAAILVLLILVCILSTIPAFTVKTDGWWFIPSQKVTAWTVVQTFLGYIILYNYIIPISLYVTIEIQKFVGSKFFEWDVDLYDNRIHEKAKANTSDLIEEMGLIEYLFSDKTGTLTENRMIFRRMAIANNAYIFQNDKLYQVAQQSSPNSSPTPTGQQQQQVHLFPAQGDEDHDDRSLSEEDGESHRSSGTYPPPSSPADTLTSDAPDTIQYTPLHTLLLHLALCHTVRVEADLPATRQMDDAMVRRRFARAVIGKLIRGQDAPKSGSSQLRRASAVRSASTAVRLSIRARPKGAWKRSGGPSPSPSNNASTQPYSYQASSPDEKAFVEACRTLNMVYHGEDESGVQVVTLAGLAHRYRLLDVLEFDATRKCMSVILQPVGQHSDQQLPYALVLCKGAETALIPRAAPVGSQPTTLTSLLQSPDLLDLAKLDPLSCPFIVDGNDVATYAMTGDQVMTKVNEFATEGLRTLVMGLRVLTLEQWQSLKASLDGARGQLTGREKAVDEAIAAIESSLTLLGCTGIEDVLQDDVADTIKSLRQAGIQVWVLTGDKEETAVNVSYSAGHFYKGMSEVRITKKQSPIASLHSLQSAIERIKRVRQLSVQTEFGLVVDGQTLTFLLEPGLRENFVECCLAVNTVLCCRLTPLQKSEVVKLMKGSRKPSPVTACIGDGANDVSMILEAHISFGIYGKEGRSAVRAADYSFGQFKFLKCALLFHGNTYYTRVANLTLYFFYKNLVFTWPQMLYSFFSLYSSQSLYPQLFLVIYNITMTAVPVFLYGIFELPLPKQTLLNYPQLYKDNSRNQRMRAKYLLPWVGVSLWHAFVSFFGAYFLARLGQIGPGDQTGSGLKAASSLATMHTFGTFVVMCIFALVNLKMLLVSYYLNYVLLLVSILAFLCNLALFIFLNYVALPFQTTSQLLGVYSSLWGGTGLGLGWFGLLGVLGLALLPDLLLRALDDQGLVWRLADLKLQTEQEQSSDRERRRSKKPGDVVTHTLESDHSGRRSYINPTLKDASSAESGQSSASPQGHETLRQGQDDKQSDDEDEWEGEETRL